VSLTRTNALPPDLRIVPAGTLHPHEEHDSQRALPLIKRLKHESVVINPPIVAPMADDQFVILDGANRYYAFSHLGYPHILVQVAPYESGAADLRTWRHVVGGWDETEFIQCLRELPNIRLVEGTVDDAIAHILLKHQEMLAVCVPDTTLHERNAALCRVVAVYQQHATLHRTAMTESEDIWRFHPDGIAILVFPEYQPADIMTAAQVKAYLPPGISRHLIHGRALRINYPLDVLRDEQKSLGEKNAELTQWIQRKLANRQVRYYAEATYQFDE
jgi:hypothetical protein